MKKRILSAAVLLPAFVAAIFFLPPIWFQGLVVLLLALASWEWARLTGLKKAIQVFAGIAILLASLCLAYLMPLEQLLAFAMAIWLFVPLFEFQYPRWSSLFKKKILTCVLGVLLLGSVQAALLYLHQTDPWMVLYLCAIIWASDSGAYFVGKAVGRHPLAPHLSPKKTWEGLVGGLAFSLLIGWLFYTSRFSTWPMLSFYGLLTVTVVFGVVGDLMISLLKRIQGLKDTGHLIPGHGGILDRVDSLLAAFPVFSYLFVCVI